MFFLSSNCLNIVATINVVRPEHFQQMRSCKRRVLSVSNRKNKVTTSILIQFRFNVNCYRIDEIKYPVLFSNIFGSPNRGRRLSCK